MNKIILCLFLSLIGQIVFFFKYSEKQSFACPQCIQKCCQKLFKCHWDSWIICNDKWIFENLEIPLHEGKLLIPQGLVQWHLHWQLRGTLSLKNATYIHPQQPIDDIYGHVTLSHLHYDTWLHGTLNHRHHLFFQGNFQPKKTHTDLHFMKQLEPFFEDSNTSSKHHITVRNHHISIESQGKNFQNDNIHVTEFYLKTNLKNLKGSFFTQLKNASTRLGFCEKMRCQGTVNFPKNNIKNLYIFAENITPTDHQKIASLHLQTKRYSWQNNQPSHFYLYLQEQQQKLSAKITLKDNCLVRSRFVGTGTYPFWIKYLPQACTKYLNNLNAKKVHFLFYYQQAHNLSGIVSMHDIQWNQLLLKNTYSEIFYNLKEQSLSFKNHVKGQKEPLQLRGNYNANDGLCLFLKGYVNPFWTYPLAEYFPNWWCNFWNNFQLKTLAYTNLYWKIMDGKKELYGDFQAQDITFKGIRLKNLDFNFANIPGFCRLNIRNLKLKNQDQGQCCVHWVYHNQYDDQEFWDLNGQGTFSSKNWQRLVQAFYKEAPTNTWSDICKSSDKITAHFGGRIFNDAVHDGQNPLWIDVQSSKIHLWDLPCSNFSCEIFSQKNQYQVKNVQAYLFKESPLSAHVKQDKTTNCTQFSLTAKQVATANLLQNVSALKTWEAAIPNDNLNAYCGLLNVDMHGQFYEHFKNFKASGSLEFDNKNLAKVHLLGPFMHVFSTKLANFSSIEFNKLQATIDVNNGLIETQKAQLLGPCAQANIQGSINVLTQQLKAKMQFSFFDYDQIKMPIVRHMVQFFQPISQGFSASIQGTFKEPRWNFYFNPFKFLFKKFHKK